ncbi:MAG: hypothetical protein OEU09_14365 [Rhodospirillales bacterium]|nr:hypothetical protein [Rhodospirillales bacterium]MDH3912473.1 hypothetical protein [Rhodospirillales bacterium]MDH3969089.1 hypothetical protein [Rhodospirillales bacterium]
MTKLLKQAFERASSLPEEEQDALAAILLEEMADEQRWAKAFEASKAVLDELAEEALEEFKHDRTTPLVFDDK